MSARGGRSILSQTFWLLVGAMIVVQVVITGSVLFLSPPRQDGVALVEIVDRLRGSATGHRPQRAFALPTVDLTAPPRPAQGMSASAALSQEFAERLGLPANQVRVYFRAGGTPFFLRFRGGRHDGIMRWRGEPVFFDRAIFAAHIGPHWRTIETPDRPFIAEWQQRTLLIFGLAIFALLPLAWLFARRLVRPIRAFADAADRVGRDASAPMVPVDGPAELRVAAQAVNAMQGRIGEQLREREAMVAAIAHDLRTPLSRIAFRIEAGDDALREPIQRDIEQMKAMITATLSYVRGSSQGGRQEPVDLGALIDEIVTNEQHVGRPVSRTDTAPLATTIIKGDPVALGRLIQNLVDNAIAYGQRADMALERGEGQARIVVADRGPGLPAADLEGMFAPFARHERSRNRETGGVGLGLAIARAIARDHGGEVVLGPRKGGGMEAVIQLPLALPMD